MPKASRADVYAAIDSELNYQQAQKGNSKRNADLPLEVNPGETLALMQGYLNKAISAWCTAGGEKDTLDNMRKVLALGARCMVDFGAPKREGF